MSTWLLVVPPVLGIAALAGLLAWQLRRRSLERCAWSYVAGTLRRRAPRRGEPIHLLLCIADHYEPGWGNASPDVANERVERWVRDYPRLFGHFRDSDGRPPRHTFFYPLEQYHAAHVEALAGLCRQGFGEVEVHLHHDRDTADGLRQRLTAFKELLAARHRLLARHRKTGDLAYGFVHGDWALDNAHPDGRNCGVNNELDVLHETGCYADFTMPSAPNEPCQTRKINSLYYALDDPNRPRSHDTGTDVGRARAPDRALLLIQGPLVLDWKRRKHGLVPRIENGCLQASQPPHRDRIDLWLRARVQVPTRPDWFFVKLHCHGAPESGQQAVLSEAMARFHQALAQRANAEPWFHYHYVTAREMYNLVRAAEAGWQGTVAEARDFELVWNGCGPRAGERAPFRAGLQSVNGRSCDVNKG
jgi:hypothetical protein